MENRTLWISSALSLILVEMALRFSTSWPNCINSSLVSKIGITNTQGIIEWQPHCYEILNKSLNSYVYDDLNKFWNFKRIWSQKLQTLPFIIFQNREDLRNQLVQKLLAAEVQSLEKNNLEFLIRTEFLKSYIYGTRPTWTKPDWKKLLARKEDQKLIERWHFDLWYQYRRSSFSTRVDILSKVLYSEASQDKPDGLINEIKLITQKLGYLDSPRFLKEKFVYTLDHESDPDLDLDVTQVVPVFLSDSKVDISKLIVLQNAEKVYWIKKSKFHQLNLEPLAISLEDFVVNNPYAEIIEINLNALRLAHKQLKITHLDYESLKENKFSKSLLKWQSQKKDAYKILHTRAPINLVARLYH